jgi:hypothetical protein
MIHLGGIPVSHQPQVVEHPDAALVFEGSAQIEGHFALGFEPSLVAGV